MNATDVLDKKINRPGLRCRLGWHSWRPVAVSFSAAPVRDVDLRPGALTRAAMTIVSQCRRCRSEKTEVRA